MMKSRCDILLSFCVLMVAASSVSCLGCNDTDRGPTFPPPGGPSRRPCEPAYERLQKVMSRVGQIENAERLNGSFDGYFTYGPLQLTVKNTQWTKGWEKIRVNKDHYLCSADLFGNKYAIHVNVELPPGQEIEGDIAIWTWGANHEEHFVIKSVKPMFLALRWQYDDAGGWSVTQAVDMTGVALETLKMQIEDSECDYKYYAPGAIEVMEGEMSKAKFPAFDKLAKTVYDLVKQEDQNRINAVE